jgi:hypothetical protein
MPMKTPDDRKIMPPHGNYYDVTFHKQGGLRERMTRVRLQYRNSAQPTHAPQLPRKTGGKP